MVVAPIFFLAGIGAFDYWLHYISGRPTRPEDHSGHGAHSWRDYFRVNTDHKVIGIQYLVTTFVFFTIGGLMAMFFRPSSHSPASSSWTRRRSTAWSLGARDADDLPVHHPGLHRDRELRRAAHARGS